MEKLNLMTVENSQMIYTAIFQGAQSATATRSRIHWCH